LIEVNHLLKQLGKQLKRSRNSTGNLAHSLKHPLNLLKQLAESNTHHSQLPLAVRQELLLNTLEIQQLIESELKRARLVGSAIPGQQFSPEKELPGLITVLKRVYHDKTLYIDYDISPGLEYPADRNDMLELYGNLLDNACKWAESTVFCEVKPVNKNDISICIEDDGNGCDKKLLSSLTQRGVRIDETTSGTGLGLAIVKDIVELYSGKIHFSQSQLGGLKVSVLLTNKTIKRS